MSRRFPPAAFYGLAIFLAALDQAVKAWVIRSLPLSGTVPLWPGIFHLTHTQNRGMAFSLLEGKTWLLSVAAVVVIGVIISVERRAPGGLGRLHGLALALPLGGAIGNLIDRLRLGYVTDFLDFQWINFPVFNVADSCITVGIALLAWRSLFHPEAEPHSIGGTGAAPLPADAKKDL